MLLKLCIAELAEIIYPGFISLVLVATVAAPGFGLRASVVSPESCARRYVIAARLASCSRALSALVASEAVWLSDRQVDSIGV
jgi:hypothetical protein